jgi:hypothetical protein
MTITKNVWKAAAILLILSLISAVMISGTYAKYTSTFAGEDTALVAKWNVITTGGGIGLTEGGTATLDLFGHTYDTNITASAGGDPIIAPGVEGDFKVAFQNNSDVAAEISFDLTKSAISANVPIGYKTTSPGGVYTDLAGLKTQLNTAFGTLDVGESATVTVYWIWEYEESDAQNVTDTALGTASAAGTGSGTDGRTVYDLTVTASAIQLTPTE